MKFFKKHLKSSTIVFVILIFLLFIAWLIFENLIEDDFVKVQRILGIQLSIDNYYQNHSKKLPKSLKELNADPHLVESYSYSRTGQTDYTLCTTFNTPSSFLTIYRSIRSIFNFGWAWNHPEYGIYAYQYPHSIGRSCFDKAVYYNGKTGMHINGIISNYSSSFKTLEVKGTGKDKSLCGTNDSFSITSRNFDIQLHLPLCTPGVLTFSINGSPAGVRVEGKNCLAANFDTTIENVILIPNEKQDTSCD